MKKIKYILILLGAIFVINGCDERLDLQPNKPSMKTYFNSIVTFQRSVYGVYAKMPDLYSLNNGEPHFGLWLTPGDDINALWDYPFDTFEGLSSEIGPLNTFFQHAYELIIRANLVIEKADENIDRFSEKERQKIKKMKGEALFLRSYWYFKLWQYYGKNIPLVKKRKVLGDEMSVGDLKAPSAGSNDTILNFCISGLKKARDLLPESWPEGQVGRVTNDAAWGLLGKLYMFRACYNDGDSEDYNLAIRAFDSINTHSIVEQYSHNFDVDTENNRESLFEFQATVAPDYEWVWYENDYDLGHGHMSAHYSYYTNKWDIMYWGEGEFGLLLPSSKLINAFDTASAARDPRYSETITKTDEDPWRGYKVVKYIKHQDNKGYQSYASTNNYRMLRMGDILLLEAEARLKTGKPDKALSLVNKIRERARNSAETDSTSSVPADFSSINMQKIMDERLRELAAEGHRWGDLKRWDAAGYIDLCTWGKQEFSTHYELSFNYPNNLVFPLPLGEVEQNPNITQNPGY